MRKPFALAVVALHAVLLWLLWLGFRARGDQEPEPPVFVTLSLMTMAPVPPIVPTEPQRPKVAPRAQRVPSVVQSPVLIQSVAPPVATEPVPSSEPPVEPQPPVNWSREAVLAAQAFARAEAAKDDTFSPPPTGIYEPCKPKESSMQWKGKDDRRAGFSGGLPFVRLGSCTITLGAFGCGFGGTPEANGHLLDDMNDPDRSRSSVPDPNVCD
jgi:hypothetical protein